MSHDSPASSPQPTAPKRMIVLVGAAFLILTLGFRIPAPGLDPDALAGLMSMGGSSRASIFALGWLPILTVLTWAEILRLACPPLARWEVASARGAGVIGLILAGLILLIAAMQGRGVIFALAAQGMMDGSDLSTAAALASFLAATALLIWLASAIRIPGLDSGLWVLIAVSAISGLPHAIAMPVELARSGAFPPWHLPMVALVTACVVMMIVFVNMALIGGRSGAAAGVSLSVMLWPPFLANAVAGVVVAVVLPDWPETMFMEMMTVQIALVAILIPVFVYAYARRDFRDRRGARPVLLAVAGVQILICVGPEILYRIDSSLFLFNARHLLVLVTVVIALRAALARPRETT